MDNRVILILPWRAAVKSKINLDKRARGSDKPNRTLPISSEDVVRGRSKAVIIVLIAVNLIFVGAIGALVVRDPSGLMRVLGIQAQSGGMSISLNAPAVVTTGDVFALEVGVQNPGEDYLVIEEIRLPKVLLDKAVVTKVFPGSMNQQHYKTMTGFEIDFTIAPGETRTFTFTLQALKAASFDVAVEVSADRQSGVAGTRLVISAPPTAVAEATPTLALKTTTGVPYEAVVKITALYMDNGSLEEGWTGSGSVVAPDGLILTNAHVVLPDKFFPVDALMISLTTEPDQLPVDTYFAEVLQADWQLDMAVLRITTDLNKNPVDRDQLNLPTVRIGDSDQIELGETLSILGYPGIGGGTITLTRGEVSGFTSDDAYGDRAFIKTSATIAGGNSGGLVADDRGQLIAVPTRLGSGAEGEYVDCRVIADTNRDGIVDNRDNCVPTGGFINALRPINLAAPLIEAASGGEFNIIEEPKPDIALPVGRELIYADDFSDDDSGWTSGAVNDGYVGYRNGAYEIQVDMDNYVYWGLSKESFSDFIVTINTRVISSSGDGEYGVICRHQDNENFYGFAVSEDGWFSIWMMEENEFEMVLDWDYSREIPTYAPLTLTVACIGNKLTLAVDGIVMAEVTDYTYSRGDIGLFAGTWGEGGFSVAFDDLVVMAP
jgi:S1-C subfamily serine protease